MGPLSKPHSFRSFICNRHEAKVIKLSSPLVSCSNIGHENMCLRIITKIMFTYYYQGHDTLGYQEFLHPLGRRK